MEATWHSITKRNLNLKSRITNKTQRGPSGVAVSNLRCDSLYSPSAILVQPRPPHVTNMCCLGLVHTSISTLPSTACSLKNPKISISAKIVGISLFFFLIFKIYIRIFLFVLDFHMV